MQCSACVLALVLLDWLAVICFLELRTDAALCVIVAVCALVLLDWLPMLCFLEFCMALVLIDWRAVIRFLEFCMDAVLCVIVTLRVLVLLDRLTVLCFLKLRCSPTVYAFAWTGRLSFGSGVLLNTVEVRGTPP
jgi:hypothetical protein